MTNTAKKLVQMMDQEQKNMHLIALEDVMRAVRLLAGWGQYPQFIESPANIFDKYHDMDIEDLFIERDMLGRLASEYAQAVHFNNQRIVRLLKDDEQDFED